MKTPSEHQEQRALVGWLVQAGVMFFSIPNGANAPPRFRRKLLDEGLEPGAPDLIVRTPPPGAPGVLMVGVEMKRRAGGHLSEAQKNWIASVRDMPWWRVLVCAGARDAVAQLRELGYGKRAEDW
jgi:hypothetical protein